MYVPYMLWTNIVMAKKMVDWISMHAAPPEHQAKNISCSKPQQQTDKKREHD